MVRPPSVSDADLISAYSELGSVHKVGARFGLHGSGVHDRLAKLGVAKQVNLFTEADRERLRRDYANYRAYGRVAELAAEMGRTVQFLSRQARALGLTDVHHKMLAYGKWRHMGEAAARVLFDDFKQSPLTLGQYCAKLGYDDEGFRNTIRGYWPDEWEHVVESKAPISSWYRLGRAVEYRVRDALKAAGYMVLRSPASRSPIDLVAIRPGRVLFIQCKRNGALPPSGWNALYDVATPAGAIPIMAENPYPRQINYWRLTDRKDGSKRRQPMAPYSIHEAP